MRLAAAAFLTVLAAHGGPAATWLPGLRRTCFPALAGIGRPDHVALTFDDGPDPDSTPWFLEALDASAVQATFFVLGESVCRYPGLARRIADRGHEIAVHGWTHDRPWVPVLRRDVRDLARAAEAVHDATGQIPQWYRPPYGILTGGRLAAAARCGLQPVLWSAWGRDWTADATAASVLATIRRDLRGGGTVLLHDTDRTAAPGCWRSALGALSGLVSECHAAGWTVGRLAEHGSGGEQAAPFVPEDFRPNGAGPLAATSAGRLPGMRSLTMTDRMDVTAVLKDQHRQIRRAFARAARPGRGRTPAFHHLVQLLATHEAAEEAHIHPTTRRIGRPAAASARAGEEQRAKEMLARLYRIGPDGAGYRRGLRSLRRAVLAHAAREEREEFPALERLGRNRRRMLGLEVKLAKELAPTRPHPRVNGELANKLAMPVLGPADRCRDLVRRWRTGA